MKKKTRIYVVDWSNGNAGAEFFYFENEEDMLECLRLASADSEFEKFYFIN